MATNITYVIWRTGKKEVEDGLASTILKIFPEISDNAPT